MVGSHRRYSKSKMTKMRVETRVYLDGSALLFAFGDKWCDARYALTVDTGTRVAPCSRSW